MNDDAMSAVGLVVLLAVVAAAAWAATTAKQVYVNRKRGEKFRVSIMRHARLILGDPDSTPMAKGIATAWLAYVYEPALLVRDATTAPVRLEADKITDRYCGKHVQVIRDGFEHLAVLALLENRRLGTAMRTLLASATISDALNGLSTRRRQVSGHERDAQWMRVSLEVAKHVELGKVTTRTLRQNALESTAA
jgi:hypothetical protein